jgi:hypothetical protein
MFRAQLPRVYELKDLIPDPDSPDAYFKDFETRLQTSPLAKACFTGLEKKLQYLHEDAWTALKNEAAQHLTRRDLYRGWPQLFDILCQTDGYKYLRDLGCSEVRFIPRADREGRRTPDLEGMLGSRKVLCEIKRMNVSDAESHSRRNYTARKYERPLDDGFFLKLQSHIGQAKDQFHAYDPKGEARHIVYISICFDEAGGFNREDELRQVEQHLNVQPRGSRSSTVPGTSLRT